MMEDVLKIEWYTGYMELYLPNFFPCSVRTFKQLMRRVVKVSFFIFLKKGEISIMYNKLYGTICLGYFTCLMAILFHLASKECDVKKIAKRLDMSVQDLSNATNVDISDKLVEEAVQLAVRREAEQRVRSETQRAVNDVKADIHRQVEKSVKDAYNSIRDDVKNELSRQVGEVNIDKIRNEVIDRAKESAAEKLEDSMDDILEKFNDNLEKVYDAYSSIAKTISDANSQNINAALEIKPLVFTF